MVIQERENDLVIATFGRGFYILDDISPLRTVSQTTFDAAAHIFLDSDDNIVISEDPNHLVTTIGISDMIIVHTKDATLICPKNESQRVKEMVSKVKDKFGNKYQ